MHEESHVPQFTREAIDCTTCENSVFEPWSHVPQFTREAIDAYWKERRPVGDFLYGVLTNDLTKACHHADGTNSAALFHIACYVWTKLPSGIWGSKEKVHAHLYPDGITEEDDKALNAMRSRGCAVVVWTSPELDGVDPIEVEDALLRYGDDVIDKLAKEKRES